MPSADLAFFAFDVSIVFKIIDHMMNMFLAVLLLMYWADIQNSLD